ncbi:AraC family transcriptional regulator [Allokutzneria albata]|uniref:HTH-type transcriptional regulator RipA n=1 Tax=Allokutzneria albata TaxID=211114 RepID=A0A1G9WL42_ALLAB|nr:helix-turn-helix transcriptional regulator [Allokutzneria albata]SDM85220.1 AraC-type DNA-binding protein [Allokutzneria albata]
MSLNGHVVPEPSFNVIMVGSLDMPGGLRFERHTHPVHQLNWATDGVITVTADSGTWVLPSTRALWIPAEVEHSTAAIGPAVMRSVYFPLADCPIDWSEPTVIAVSPLLGQLIDHLSRDGLPADARARAEAVVFDLLEPVSVTTLELPTPADARARAVTDALRADPADDRDLASWGRFAGAGERTLARLFVGETGMTFGHWRAQNRMCAALPLLAEGMAVGTVARRVGYGTASAFVAAFRRAFGVSPGNYFSAR